jgi:cytochrome P450
MDHPEMIPRAREEFLRYFTPIHGTARNISKATVVRGEQMLPGERVLLAYASGNRDEGVFEDADRIIMDRTPNPHIGFGAGIHRCVGSFVARMMFEVMLAEVLERLPDFRVLEDQAKRFPSISEVNGWIAMPAIFTPGRKLADDVDYF